MAELILPDPCCVLLAGAAGSGKSTFAARHFPSEMVLSSDAYRAAIAGDPSDQTATPAAFRALHRTLDRRLGAGRSAVIDATNVQPAARVAITRIAARHRVPVVAVVLDLPAVIVQQRNARRPERTVPVAVVDRQLAELGAAVGTGALEGEGYARIVLLRDAASIDDLNVRFEPSAPGVPAGPGEPG